MIFFIIYFTSIIIVTLGFGLLVKNFLIKEGLIYSMGVGDTGLLGFYFILLLSFLLHFFLPINYYINGLIFFIGIILFPAISTIHSLFTFMSQKIFLIFRLNNISQY